MDWMFGSPAPQAPSVPFGGGQLGNNIATMAGPMPANESFGGGYGGGGFASSESQQGGWGAGPWGVGGGANPQPFSPNLGQTSTQQGNYNNLVSSMRQLQQSGQFNPQTWTQMMGAQGIPPQVAQILWQNLSAQNFAPLQSSSGTNDTAWEGALQNASNAYNQNLQQGAYSQAPPFQAPTSGGYGYQGPPQQAGGFNPGWSAPPWMQGQGSMPSWLTSYLTQNGWTAPPAGQASNGGTAPPTSPTSNGAPPWAQSLSSGGVLPQFTNQPSLPLASSQEWANYLPQEQQAILSTAQSVGIDPQAYLQQLAYSAPEWGAMNPASFRGY